MANLTNKYLDLIGLEAFWNRAKNYISKEILDIDGTKVLLNNNDADSHSITFEISEIWKVLGGGAPGEGSGNLSQDVSTILGAYIKSFQGVEGSYITIGPSNKTNGAVDVKLTLNETKLTNALSAMKNVYENYTVNDIKFTDNNGAITLDSTNVKHGSKTISQVLEDVSNWDLGVTKLTAGDDTGDLVQIVIDKTDGKGDVTISIDDTKLNQSILNIANNVVSSIDGQKGAITLDSTSVGAGHVNFSITDNQISGIVVGLGTGAYDNFEECEDSQIYDIFGIVPPTPEGLINDGIADPDDVGSLFTI